MEFSGIIVLIIVVIYFTKNDKGKEIVGNIGDTAVHLSSAANKASAALERQCDELLMNDEEVKKLQAKVKADMAAEAKAKTSKVDNSYDDFA